MTKKSIFSLALGALLLASCAEEQIISKSDGNVSFTASLPAGIMSRSAYDDGLTATHLDYAVYDSNGTNIAALNGEAQFTDRAATVNLNLVSGKTYTIVFWASAPGADFYTFDAESGTVTVAGTGKAHDQNRDAFFASESFTVTGALSKTVTLKRPFAQINIGTSDLDDFLAAGGNITKAGITVLAPETLNLIDGTVEGETTYELTPDLFVEGVGFPVATTPAQRLLTTNFILVDRSKSTIDVTWTSDNDTPGREAVVFTHVPVQRNYRTNIYGALLTNPAHYDVEIAPEFEDGDNNENQDIQLPEITPGVTYDKEAKTFYLSTADGLMWFVNATNKPAQITVSEGSPLTADAMKTIAGNTGTFPGQTVKLAANIDMTGQKFTPIQFQSNSNGLQCVFDGCNYTISNLSYSTKVQGAQVGFIAKLNSTVQNLNIDNASFTGINYVGGVVGGLYGSVINCHVSNSTLTANVHTDNGEGADIGGIVGFVRDTKGNIENCSATNVTIKGCRDVGGIVGKYQGYQNGINHITGCQLTDVDINIVIPADYAEYGDKIFNRGVAGQPETFGPIAGFIMPGNNVPTTNLDGSANPDNNILKNVNITVIDGKNPGALTATSADVLYNALMNGYTDITLAPGQYVFGKPLYDGGNQRFNGFNEAVTLKADGAIVTNNVSPNFKGATIDGITLQPTDNRIIGCFNGNFKNCRFIGGMYTESKATPSTFENCYFYCEDVTTPGFMAFHIGILNEGNTVTLTDCTIDGRCDFGVAGNLTFKDCTLYVKADWGLYGAGIYTFDNCKVIYSDGASIKNMGNATVVGL